MTGFTVCHWARYIAHFWFAVETDFYSDVVECLPEDPATWVCFGQGEVEIFSLNDTN